MTIVKLINEEKETIIAQRNQNLGLYTIPEIAKMFITENGSISKQTFYEACGSGELPYVSPNNKTWFVFLDDVMDWLKLKKIEATSAKVTSIK